jgi:hypothetical protein
MRTKQGALALLTCSAVALGGLAVESAAARTVAPVKHAKKSTKKSAKKSKRCKIVLVNGIHRCKGEHARKTISSNSSTAPAAPAPVVNNVTINNIDNPPAPVPAPAAPAAAITTPAPSPTPGNGPKDQNGDGKPGNGPKDKDKDHGKGHHSH